MVVLAVLVVAVVVVVVVLVVLVVVGWLHDEVVTGTVCKYSITINIGHFGYFGYHIYI